MWPPPEIPAPPSGSASRTSRRRPDAADALAIGGAAAVVSSLLLLPWFTLSFRWVGSVSVSFGDLRELFAFATDNGFDAGMQYFYVQWGYLLSFVSVAVVPVLALGVWRTGRVPMRRLLGVASAVTAFAGVGQAIIAGGLTSLDEQGSVRFGLWWGVAGHLAMVAACVLAANRASAIPPEPPRPL